MNSLDVIAFLWFLWAAAGSIAWTFALWDPKTQWRWLVVLLVWLFVLGLGDANKRRREERVHVPGQ
jgi:uncharacterized membrane protein YeiB